MNEVVVFLSGFIQKEFEAHQAFYAEPDPGVYARRLEELEKFYAVADGVYLGLGGRGEWSAEDQQMREKKLTRIVPRVLFQVKRYAPSGDGGVFRAYLSGEFKYNRQAYGRIVHVVHVGGGPLIVSVEGQCLSCSGRGFIGEEPCSACGGKGWEHASGRPLRDLGPPVEVLKLQAPGEPVSLSDYEAP